MKRFNEAKVKEEQREEEKKKKFEQKMAQIEVKNEVHFCSCSSCTFSSLTRLMIVIPPAAPGRGEGQEKSCHQASGGAGAEEEAGRRG